MNVQRWEPRSGPQLLFLKVTGGIGLFQLPLFSFPKATIIKNSHLWENHHLSYIRRIEKKERVEEGITGHTILLKRNISRITMYMWCFIYPTSEKLITWTHPSQGKLGNTILFYTDMNLVKSMEKREWESGDNFLLSPQKKEHDV